MEELLGRTALASMQFRNVFGHSSGRSLTDSLCTCLLVHSLLRQFILRCSFLCHVALPNACQFC